MAVFYADKKKSETLRIPLSKCTISDGMEDLEKMHLSYPCAPITIDLAIPVFINLDIAALKNTGIYLKKIS